MKIKMFFAALILCAAVGTRAHAFGLGAQFNFSAGDIFAPGFALAYSPSDNFHFAFNWYFGSGDTNIIGLTMDLCPLVFPLIKFGAGTFNLALGVGLYANVLFTDDPSIDGGLGLRVPIGLNVMLGRDIIEIFAHVAPSFGVHLLPTLEFSMPFYPIALGARLWIH